MVRLCAGLGCLVRFGLRLAIRLYQLCLRPMLGPNCRFEPSCSDYALEAILLHGSRRGVELAGLRILRCNPWHPGGVDPVPGVRCACGQPYTQDRDRPFR